MFVAVSEIAIWLVVPFIVTEDLIPEPEPPAVKLRTAELAPPAATGNVYVSFVSGAKAIKLDTAISFTVFCPSFLNHNFSLPNLHSTFLMLLQD